MTSLSNRQQALALLERLEDDRLPDAIAALEALNQPILPVTSPEEADLIAVINHRLPIAQQQRLQVLRLRLEAESLTEEERAMFELATLRGVDLMEIVQEFRDAIAVN
jgi:DNA-directed RNA polymerase specialized sigma24 family protein